MMPNRKWLEIQTLLLRYSLRILGVMASFTLIYACGRHDATSSAMPCKTTVAKAKERPVSIPANEKNAVKGYSKQKDTPVPGNTYDPGKTIHPVAYGTPVTDYRTLTVPDTASN